MVSRAGARPQQHGHDASEPIRTYSILSRVLQSNGENSRER